jgi:hypothetical protein
MTRSARSLRHLSLLCCSIVMNSNGEEVLKTVDGFRATGVILYPGCLEVGSCFRHLMLALEEPLWYRSFDVTGRHKSRDLTPDCVSSIHFTSR